MKLVSTLHIDREAQKKSLLITDLFRGINDFIKNKKYGHGIYQYMISLYVINPPEGYEHLFKDFKPKFTEHKLTKNRFTGERVEIKKQFHYSIRIDGNAYSDFVKASKMKTKKILASEILKSLSNLDALPKKVKDFNRERFKSDIENYFRKIKLNK